jgi:hypothetical protein
MNPMRVICWARNSHRFQLPPGPDETVVDVDHLACLTCGKDFLELVAFHEEISREAARGYFVSPYINPALTMKEPKKDAPVKKSEIRNSWWR